MGIKIHNPFFDRREDELQLDATLFRDVMVEQSSPILPAEWYPQSGVQLTWPHQNTDWAYMLDEVQACFKQVAKEIAARELLLIVTPEPEAVKAQIADSVNMKNVRFFQCPTNDTWARDHGAICLTDSISPHILDFCFNGWGNKFPAEMDNAITRQLYEAKMLNGTYENHLDFVLEGGSIESDGHGTLLTTTQCLLNPNRNPRLNAVEIEEALKVMLHVERILWLHHGNLRGDDTDSHIDTLARFCSTTSIAYVQCNDPDDEHYEELQLMEEELKAFRQADGTPYQLFPLPMAAPVWEDGEQLPATYANFLILNDAVLYPIYQQTADAQAREVLQAAFPKKEIVGVDCRPLICQHGSLHCITMQYPIGVLK
ncbi:MAG: agmatine deiminase family protein [Bacteroidaceae bacterium]|nr:agmatine deiminase family protein [Bacteroidaceae bacterium]